MTIDFIRKSSVNSLSLLISLSVASSSFSQVFHSCWSIFHEVRSRLVSSLKCLTGKERWSLIIKYLWQWPEKNYLVWPKVWWRLYTIVHGIYLLILIVIFAWATLKVQISGKFYCGMSSAFWRQGIFPSVDTYIYHCIVDMFSCVAGNVILAEIVTVWKKELDTWRMYITQLLSSR